MQLDRLMANIRRIVRSEFPNYTYQGIYEYSIQSVSDSLVDADPVDTSIGLPSIAKMPMRSSILGETVTPTVGKLCLVMFVNGVPSRPMVFSCAAKNEEIDVDATSAAHFGDSASAITVGGSGPPCARLGDTLLAGGMFAGTITSGSSKVTVGG